MEDQILNAAKGKPLLTFISSVQGEFAGPEAIWLQMQAMMKSHENFYFA